MKRRYVKPAVEVVSMNAGRQLLVSSGGSFWLGISWPWASSDVSEPADSIKAEESKPYIWD